MCRSPARRWAKRLAWRRTALWPRAGWRNAASARAHVVRARSRPGTRPRKGEVGVPLHLVPDVVAESGLCDGGWVGVEPADPRVLVSPRVYALGDVANAPVPRAGVLAETAGRVVAEQILAEESAAVTSPPTTATAPATSSSAVAVSPAWRSRSSLCPGRGAARSHPRGWTWPERRRSSRLPDCTVVRAAVGVGPLPASRCGEAALLCCHDPATWGERVSGVPAVRAATSDAVR